MNELSSSDITAIAICVAVMVAPFVWMMLADIIVHRLFEE